MLEVLPRETVYSLRRSTKGDVQQMFIPDEENLYDSDVVTITIVIRKLIDWGKKLSHALHWDITVPPFPHVDSVIENNTPAQHTQHRNNTKSLYDEA